MNVHVESDIPRNKQQNPKNIQLWRDILKQFHLIFVGIQ